MQMGNRQGFLQQGAKALDGIYDWMQSLEPVSLKELPPKTALFWWWIWSMDLPRGELCPVQGKGVDSYCGRCSLCMP